MSTNEAVPCCENSRVRDSIQWDDLLIFRSALGTKIERTLNTRGRRHHCGRVRSKSKARFASFTSDTLAIPIPKLSSEPRAKRSPVRVVIALAGYWMTELTLFKLSWTVASG